MGERVSLDVLEGPLAGRSFVLGAGEVILVGRGDDCQVRIEGDKAISRHHFRLYVNPPLVGVQDLGSRHGIEVNGVKHRRRRTTPAAPGTPTETAFDAHLGDGDTIKVGHTVFAVRIEKSPAQSVMNSGDSTTLCARCGRPVSMCGGKHDGSEGSVGIRERPARQHPIQVVRELLALRHTGSVSARPELPEFPEVGDIGEPLYHVDTRAVYPARWGKDGRRVALKVLRVENVVDEPTRCRFQREVDIHKLLHHPNVVDFLGHGSVEHWYYFLTEFCEGGSIQDILDQGGPLSLKDAGAMALQALDGLVYAHTYPPPDGPFVHRDLKPANILLSGPEGSRRARIADFGLAKNFALAGLSGITDSGAPGAGTPKFMPPEQIEDFKYQTPVSDVWAMGATLYHMLTGAYPFDFESGVHYLVTISCRKIVPIHKRLPGLPPRVVGVLDRALAFKPEDRYQTAAEFRDALGDALRLSLGS